MKNILPTKAPLSISVIGLFSQIACCVASKSRPRRRPIFRLDSHPHWPRERHPAEPPQQTYTHEIALCENKKQALLCVQQTSVERTIGACSTLNWSTLDLHSHSAPECTRVLIDRPHIPPLAPIIPLHTCPFTRIAGWRQRVINCGADAACLHWCTPRSR